MLKKIWYKIRTFFYLFFKGLHQADKVAFGDKEGALNKDSSYEQQQEQDCVWSDLIKGELTQRVKDLRYETAHAVRESKKYEYIGNGNVVKKNIFEYNGKAYKEDGDTIILVQDNFTIVQGVYNLTPTKEYVIKTVYSFKPKFRVDSYIKKIVLRKDCVGNYKMDIYFSEYLEKYNNEHKFFIAELKKLSENIFLHTDITDIEKIVFTTNKSFGENDDVIYNINIQHVLDIKKFDGNYILSFSVNIENKQDMIELVYDEKSAEKFNKKEKRTEHNSVISFKNFENKHFNDDKNKEFYKNYKILLDELDETEL